MTTLSIARDDALGAEALALIAQSETEPAALYLPEVRYAFSPDELRNAGAWFVVGREGATPVTCGGVALLDGHDELKRIFVTRVYRGRGHADAIVAALEDIARQAGHSCMRLETGHASPEALRFYARNGYRKIGPFGDYREHGSSVFMEKTL